MTFSRTISNGVCLCCGTIQKGGIEFHKEWCPEWQSFKMRLHR